MAEKRLQNKALSKLVIEFAMANPKDHILNARQISIKTLCILDFGFNLMVQNPQKRETRAPRKNNNENTEAIYSIKHPPLQKEIVQ